MTSSATQCSSSDERVTMSFSKAPHRRQSATQPLNNISTVVPYKRNVGNIHRYLLDEFMECEFYFSFWLVGRYVDCGSRYNVGLFTFDECVINMSINSRREGSNCESPHASQPHSSVTNVVKSWQISTTIANKNSSI